MIFGGVLGMFGALILLGPTIASSSAVRQWVVGRINQNLNGRLEIDDWSMGWRRPLEIRGMRIHDEQGRMIFECAAAKTGLGFMNLLRGRLALGRVVLTEPNCDILEIDASGGTNWGRIWRESASEGRGRGGGTGREENAQGMASVTGEFVTDTFRATVVAAEWGGENKAVVVDPSKVRLKIAGADQPVENDMTLNLHSVSGMHRGVVAMTGTAHLGDDITANESISMRLPGQKGAALEMSISGTIGDVMGRRTLENVRCVVEADLQQVWSLVLPILPAKAREALAEMRLAGHGRRTVTMGGAFPAGRPFAQAIEQVVADADVGFDTCDWDGLHLANAAFGLHLEKGILRPAGPAVIACNQGKLDLTGTSIALDEAHVRLDIPPQTALARGVNLNAELADKLLGRYLSPIFLRAKSARGTIDVTAIVCRRLPLDGLVQSDEAGNDGRAELALQISHANITGGEMEHYLKQVQLQEMAAQVEANVASASLVVEKGTITQDVPLAIGDLPPLRFRGNLELDRMYYNPLKMVVSRQLLEKTDFLGLGLADRFPDGWTFGFRGPSRALKAIKGTRFDDMMQEGMAEPKK